MNKTYKIILYKKLSGEWQVQFNQLIQESFFLNLTKTKLEENKDKFCSQKDKIGYLLALENQKIIGILVLLKRKLIFNHQKLILGGFGGLCVVEAKRKQGIATALLKKGMARLKQENCDIAYLNRQHTYLGSSGKRYTEHDAMIAPVNSPKKFKAVLRNDRPFDIGVGNW